MTALTVNPPYDVFTDIDGNPLEAGFIYIGEPNQDPVTHPVAVYWDANLTIPAAQPIRTSGGYPVHAGSPSKMYIDGVGYSIKVTNKNGSFIYSFPNNSGISPNADGVSFNQGTTNSVNTTVAQQLRLTLNPISYGAVGDGVADDTAAIVKMLTDVPDGGTIDLMGKSYALFVGNNGVSSGDAIPLADVPRLYNRNNITIKNGHLFAANPGVSPTKVRYPTTFTVDGCTNITFQNVRFDSRGESYGDVDASAPLNYEQRRAFGAQNGGHALLIVRSLNTTVNDSHFERCGSCGVVYMMSSSETVLNNCFSTAMSLGYAAYAMDGWAGTPSTTGFNGHKTTLNDCITHANGSTYGSKGCVVTEDTGTTVYINGGVYRDAYANGGAHQLGNAFTASSSNVYVTGAQVENCASVGLSGSTSGTDTILEIVGVVAKGIRTSMHIVANQSFTSHFVKYLGCSVQINGSSLWSESELSVPTIVANMKVTSGCSIDIFDCVTEGAHTFAINTKAVYGGIRVIGGRHKVTDRIFDSAGWGGAGSGTFRGYELRNVRMDVLLANTAVVSTAITQATTAVNAIKNRDDNNAFTYRYLDFDKASIVNSNLMRNFVSLLTYGSGLVEKEVLSQELNFCWQGNNAGEPKTTAVRVVSLDGLAGSNSKVTFAFLNNRVPAGGKLVSDDVYANRALLSAITAAAAVGSELQQQWYVNGATYNLTAGTVYNLVTQG